MLLMSATSMAETEKPDPIPDSDFTIVVIPDTQHYLGPGTKIEANGGHPLAKLAGEPYADPHLAWAKAQTFPENEVINPYLERHIDWILENRETQRIAFVSHVGDIVEKDREVEWEVAATSFKRLLGIVPFGLTVGNHDMTSKGDAHLFQAVFPKSLFADQPWYLESYEHDRADEPFVSRNNVNSAQLFSAGGVDFIFVHLECNAPDDVLAWANRLIRSHPKRRALISTHMDLGIVKKPKTQDGFIHDPKGRMEWTKNHGKQGNTAVEMWEKCYQLHPNLDFVFSGDQSRVTALKLSAAADDGHLVHSLLSDYHSLGAIRLLRFRPKENRVDVVTYDTMLGNFVEATPYVPEREQHQFSLEWFPDGK